METVDEEPLHGNATANSHYYYILIYNKILDHDWFSARLFVM